MLHKVLLSLLIGSALAACSSDVDLHPREMCPPLVEWTQNDSDALAYEIDKFYQQAPMMTRAVRELYLVRHQCKDMDKEKKDES